MRAKRKRTIPSKRLRAWGKQVHLVAKWERGGDTDQVWGLFRDRLEELELSIERTTPEGTLHRRLLLPAFLDWFNEKLHDADNGGALKWSGDHLEDVLWVIARALEGKGHGHA